MRRSHCTIVMILVVGCAGAESGDTMPAATGVGDATGEDEQPPPAGEEEGGEEDTTPPEPEDDDASTGAAGSSSGEVDASSTGSEEPETTSGGESTSTGPVELEDWSGTFVGMFTGGDTADLTLVLDCTDGEITGTANDYLGNSVIENGTCTATDMSFDKRYIDGDAIGGVNQYTGTRDDDHLEGTWMNPSLSGEWYADAE